MKNNFFPRWVFTSDELSTAQNKIRYVFYYTALQLGGKFTLLDVANELAVTPQTLHNIMNQGFMSKTQLLAISSLINNSTVDLLKEIPNK